MTENKSIYVDGVDVSKCVYNDCEYCTISKEAYCYCCDKPNCYFKQLAHKTQECEELKSDIENLTVANNYYFKENKKLKRKKQEYEMLEVKLNSYNEVFEQLEDSFINSPYVDGGLADYYLDIINKVKD